MTGIHVTLTHKWFDEIKAGRKTSEYRRRTPYWERVLSRIKPGDYIVFHRGYSDQALSRKILSVRTLTGWGLPNEEYHFFKCPNETEFFEIIFEKRY